MYLAKTETKEIFDWQKKIIEKQASYDEEYFEKHKSKTQTNNMLLLVEYV